MIEVRWHGRGGDGAFTAAKILGHTASIYENRYGQAFPSFGPERRGAPVLGFTKISDDPITDHSQVYQCDCVIVLDETLCETVDTTVGIKKGGVYVINSKKSSDQIKKEFSLSDDKSVITIDAYDIAMKYLGVPIVNTVLLGAAVGASHIADMAGVEQSIEDMFSKNLRDKNKKAARSAYEIVKKVVDDEKAKLE